MIRAIHQRLVSRTFLRSFILILIAQIVVISVARLLLDFNTDRWIRDKAQQAMRISQQAALSADWSRVDRIPRDQDSESQLDDRYGDMLLKFSRRYFLRNEGVLYLVVIDRGEEYNEYPGIPMSNNDRKANASERAAYVTRKPTYAPTPITDDNGTYLAGYTPILRKGVVIGLVGAQYDSATLADFKGIVQTTFWLSIIPAILVSLVAAFVLASTFVEPIDVLRTIEETAQSQQARSHAEEGSDPWHLLTGQEKQIAELLRQGHESAKEIADALSLTTGTVYTYLKRIKAKTGWSKQGLALQAAARRSASALLSP